jgi:hypothetical protein
VWRFHEAYKALDLKAIDGYPNKCPINQFDVLPKFNGNPLLAIARIVEFTRCIYYENVQHEYVSYGCSCCPWEVNKGIGSRILASQEVYLL